MGNMSYCRFQNTLQDLRDCYENMDDHVNSAEETRARRALILLCRDISDDYMDDDYDMPDDDEPAEDMG